MNSILTYEADSITPNVEISQEEKYITILKEKPELIFILKALQMVPEQRKDEAIRAALDYIMQYKP